MVNYILYKYPIQFETLTMVQYIHFVKKLTLLPLYCIERNHPSWTHDTLPCIHDLDHNIYYKGLRECEYFYRLAIWENGYPGEENEGLLKSAIQWKKEKVNCRINT